MEPKSGKTPKTRSHFDNAFDVPLSPEKAWPVLSDIRRVASCLPGVALTKVVDPSTYEGKFAVPLGPTTLTFSGVVKVENLDAKSRKARISARGADDKDESGAMGVASFEIVPEGKGSKVLVHTDLNLTGMAAQYGDASGAIEATAARTVAQFANNLRAQITASHA